ncbi:hypothetical protein KR067_006350 [Drosophila pandora]|nr:hypothetical protein KR067_006350 [Drosophila pandora]
MIPKEKVEPTLPVEVPVEFVPRRSDRIKNRMELERIRSEEEILEKSKQEELILENSKEKNPKAKRVPRRSASNTTLDDEEYCSCCGVDMSMTCPTCGSKVNLPPPEPVLNIDCVEMNGRLYRLKEGETTPEMQVASAVKTQRNAENRQRTRRNLGVSSSKPQQLGQAKKRAAKRAAAAGAGARRP